MTDRTQSEFRVKAVEMIPSVSLLHQYEQDGASWGTHGRWILRSQNGDAWQKVTRFPFAAPRDYFAFSRPTVRAARADKCNLYQNKAGILLAIRAGQVYRLDQRNQLEPFFTIQGDSVLHGGICEDSKGWTYFGEYFMNPGRGQVVIWRIDPEMRRCEAAYHFNAGSIRHVHGIYRDPYDEDVLWAPVGDYTGECFFYRSHDRFKTVERIGDGTQLWRAVRLFFTPEHICWLTDSQLEQNVACRLNRASGVLEIGQSLDAPAWYGTRTREGLYIAFTTVEPGAAVKRDTAAVLVSLDAFHWQEAHQFQKDSWRPMKLFKYGVISCPSGEMDAASLLVSGEGLVGLDGVSARLQLVRDRP